MAPGWWDLVGQVKNSIAKTIREQLRIKHTLNLYSSWDPDLHMCQICGCCLKLKVWTPIEHIKAHFPKENLTKLPPHCWMLKEYEEDSTKQGVRGID